jgi:hypothetical protein
MSAPSPLASLGIVWSEDGHPDGYQIGKSAALLDWQHKREACDFEKLVGRLQARKYWANKNPLSKARIKAYRRAWQVAHREQMNACSRASKARRRRDPKVRAAEAAEKRRARELKHTLRLAETVYMCAVCGTQWHPSGRIPSQKPKYCSQRCRGKGQYEAAKARKAPWLRVAWRQM